MICTSLIIFTDSVQTDTLEKCLLSQGFEHYIAAGDSLALTGPRRTEYIPLQQLPPMALEGDRRDLPNRVNRDEVCVIMAGVDELTEAPLTSLQDACYQERRSQRSSQHPYS
jgi:hypothetical protein